MNIIGRLTKDAKAHPLSNEKHVVNSSVATKDSHNTCRVTCRAKPASMCLLANSKRGKTAHKRHFGRTHRQSKHKGMERQRRKAKSRAYFHISQTKLHGSSRKAETVQATTESENNVFVEETTKTSHFNSKYSNYFLNIKILSKWHTTLISTREQDVIHSLAFSKRRGTV
ncbi:hypothetical protein P0M11_11260 [Kaistella sp. PBT33-4]|uniref:hypothetical protein n=1 Tax=Kaistella sp. PBT33-4 TaxID=3032000 RepID=UPI0023D8BCE1|nr:hypothetical protein [Kaistella sp. PBT33-4]MDF0720575.1 hypothetical protein [Kaistella sp. PBT33-4]